MPPKLRPVTAKALQALLTRIGSASSGTKDVLHERFKRDLARPRLFALRPAWQARQKKAHGRQLRILSIDMGIKNLAFCDVSVDYTNGNPMTPTMDITRWDKLNLVDATRDLRLPVLRSKDADEGEDIDPYSLSVLSRTAYSFIKKEVLQAAPDIVLIERQRWRSAGSAAILQWTVRVNTLEAMLWAVLETLRTERLTVSPKLKDEDVRKRDFEVYGVDPKRVGQFWLGQHARARAEDLDEAVDALAMHDAPTKAAAKKIPRSKAEKKAKIALLRSWLSTESMSTAPSTPGSAPVISIDVSHGAVKAREALQLPVIGTTRTKKAKGSDDEIGDKDMKKLDDITDCCLQAAAWIAWESNRLQLYNLWDAKRGEDGSLTELDDEILRKMVEVAGE